MQHGTAVSRPRFHAGCVEIGKATLPHLYASINLHIHIFSRFGSFIWQRETCSYFCHVFPGMPWNHTRGTVCRFDSKGCTDLVHNRRVPVRSLTSFSPEVHLGVLHCKEAVNSERSFPF